MDLLKDINLADFVKRVIKSGVSSEEIDSVMSAVAAAIVALGPGAYSEDDDKGADLAAADLLDILSYANDTSYKDLVASFLHGRNVQAAVVALSVLGTFYDLTEEYAKEIAELILGVPWDPFNTVEECAAGLARAYLKEQEQPELLSALIETGEGRGLVGK